MLISAFVIIFECILCKILIQPNGSENLEGVSWALLILNIFVVFIGVYSSINKQSLNSSSKTTFTPKQDLDEKNAVMVLILLSFILRICILIWDIYARHIFILPNSEGDAEWYHIIGTSYAFGPRSNLVDYKKYVYYVGLLYKTIGVQKMFAQFINIFLAICSIVLIYKILCRFNISSKIRKRTIFFVSFLPNLMMITTFMLQESIIAFFIIASLYFFTKWWHGDGIVYIVLAVIMSLLGSLLHMGGLTIGLGIMFMLVLIGNKDRIAVCTAGRVIAMILVGALVLMALVTFGGDFLGKLGGDVSVESILGESTKREEGGAVYTIGISGLPPAADLIVNTPIRVFYFIFSPLPWDWRGLGDILAFFGSTIFYFYTAYYIIKAIKAKPLKKLSHDNIGSFLITLLVIVLIAGIMFGWGVSNAGSVLRHREKFTYIFVVISAVTQEILFRVGKNNESKNIDNSPDL